MLTCSGRNGARVVTGFVLLILLLLPASPAGAFPSFFSSRGCSTCHSNDTATCNGCHHHKGTLTATADQAEYNPGDPVTVTLFGGNQTGWIRGLLYDHLDQEIDRKSGPTETGDDGMGNPVTFPVQLQGTAPNTPGDYVWRAAWYGNTANSGSTHGEVRTSVVIHVVVDPSDVPDEPPLGSETWGKIKRFFGRR